MNATQLRRTAYPPNRRPTRMQRPLLGRPISLVTAAWKKRDHRLEGHRFENPTRPSSYRGGGRRAPLRLAAVVLLLGLHALGAQAARAGEVADAKCPPMGPFSGFGRDRFAQTFRAQHTGKLTRATILAHSPSPANTDDWLVEIRKTTRKGKPGKTVLAATQVDDIVRPAPGQTTPVSVEFTPGARVEKGERYALVIARVNGAKPNVQSNTVPSCAGALFEDEDLDNAFRRYPGTHVVFATFVAKP